jgi:hypothetical protein
VANRNHIDTAQRFEEYVDRSGGPRACHIWLGSTNEKGYGQFRVGGSSKYGGKVQKAHRVAFGLEHNVTLPPSIHLHHKCERHICVNSRHLEPKTPKDHARLHALERTLRPFGLAK